ncbi:GrpE protein [Penicillium macrosclerotiorum]|uniref:GrpE protein n=1 Tax=Penicillium macrosclerotiorum TaxID=303699 RepID=UPI00254736FA|nr:GrpE protein [Penicillium macrosclerotiorum]KAJ5688739.1 GrpE protein [Penicillium macrosclerotiorum]
MFQRTFFRQAQAARSVLTASTSTSAAPLALRRTTRLQSQLPSALRPFAPQPARRFYSTENNAEKKEASQDAEASEKGEAAEDPILKELEEKKKESADLKDKLLRSVADFRNLQDRTKRDMDNARNFAIQRFAKDLLESIDNFDRALLAVPAEKLSAEKTEANKDLLDLVEGLKMTEKTLMNTLQKHGLERFDPSESVEGKPQKFDPNLHEATFMAPSQTLENGDVMYTQSKGFLLNGRVVRAAKVGVVKNA